MEALLQTSFHTGSADDNRDSGKYHIKGLSRNWVLHNPRKYVLALGQTSHAYTENRYNGDTLRLNAIEDTDEFPEKQTIDSTYIWTLYAREARKHDHVQLEIWNRSLDVLLILAGLLAATLTTFIVDSYHNLLPSSGQSMTILSNDFVVVPRMLNTNGTIVRTNDNNTNDSTVSLATRWINGLWSTSLVCTLTVALTSMLVKQWLQSYSSSNTSNDPRTWARVRQHCISRIYRWRICCIITALPLLLHASLSLFLVGFAVLFWTADIIIGIVTALLISIIFVFYGTTFFLPLVHPDCPFESPLLECIGTLQAYLYGLCCRGTSELRDRAEPCRPANYAHNHGAHHWHGKVNAEFILEYGLIDMEEEVLDAKALAWLIEASTDSVVLRQTFRTLPSLSYSKDSIQRIRTNRTIRLVEQCFLDCFQQKKSEGEMQCSLTNVEDAMIYCHAMIIMSDESPQNWPIKVVECLWALQNSHVVEAKALASCALSRHALVHDLNAWDVLDHLFGASRADTMLTPQILELLVKTVVEYVKEGALNVKHVIPALVPLLRRDTIVVEDNLGFVLCRAFQHVAHDYESSFCPQCMADKGDKICRPCFHQIISRCLIRIINKPAQYGVSQSQGLLVAELAHWTIRIINSEGVGAIEHDALHKCASSAVITLASLLVNSRLLTSAGLSHVGFAEVMSLLAQFPSHIQLSHFSLPVRLAELLESPSNIDETVLQNVLIIVETALRNASFGVDRLRIFNLVGGQQVLISLGLTVGSPVIRKRIRELVELTLRRLATALAKASEQKNVEQYSFMASTGDFLANNFLDLTMDLFMCSSNNPLSPATFLDLSYIMHALCYRHPNEPQWRGLVSRIEEWLVESLERNSKSDALLEAWAHVMSMHELLDIENLER